MKQFSKFFLFMLLSVAALSFTSCSKDDGPDQAALDQQTQVQQKAVFNKSMKKTSWLLADYNGSIGLTFDKDENKASIMAYRLTDYSTAFAMYKYSCNVTVMNGMVVSKSITFTMMDSSYNYGELPKKLTATVSNGVMVMKNGDTGEKIGELY